MTRPPARSTSPASLRSLTHHGERRISPQNGGRPCAYPRSENSSPRR
jgi:hypothetical protein